MLLTGIEAAAESRSTRPTIGLMLFALVFAALVTGAAELAVVISLIAFVSAAHESDDRLRVGYLQRSRAGPGGLPGGLLV